MHEKMELEIGVTVGLDDFDAARAALDEADYWITSDIVRITDTRLVDYKFDRVEDGKVHGSVVADMVMAHDGDPDYEAIMGELDFGFSSPRAEIEGLSLKDFTNGPVWEDGPKLP